MIHSSSRRAHSPAPESLTRAELLSAALSVLEHARVVEMRAAQLLEHPELSRVIVELATQREVLARRASNVALAAVVPADELRLLQLATRRVASLEGYASCRVTGMTRMN
jgi:hypothetical protein